jgi:hypothetical protein
MISLDELANKHNTDKGTAYLDVSVHGYAPIYDTYLSNWRDSEIRLLEIGVCMEYTPGGQSVRMWHEYFPNASIYTFDIVDMKGLETELGERVKFYKGDQGSRTDLENMYKEFGSKEFDFILEDGSHIHHHQMISLAYLFKYVKSGGYYILEDITEDGFEACCQRNDETIKIIKALQNKEKVSSEFIFKEELNYLNKNISKIEIFPDIKNEYRTAIIHKK